ncbi:hypothetical protein TGS27_0773 [Geobacillus stearothermophilus]|nr:hypothetical protein TGS27_0773 [Geobacillus stearothermophilus]
MADIASIRREDETNRSNRAVRAGAVNRCLPFPRGKGTG